MSNESTSKCPQCGAPLLENAPSGLCPNCLMALNLQTETVLSGEPRAAQPPLPSDQIAPHFPQLEILECLGRGGMGVVYKARQKTLNRFVALKLLAPERVNDSRFAERFAREAQALAALNHPNIVTIHDFGQAGGFYFLLMEFVDGVNLRELLRARKFTPEEALSIVPPLCDALQFAHERGIVHRDIKPENLLLDKNGRVKIADFGIAKMLGTADGGSGGTAGGATQNIVGTRGYSAPEQQASPERVDSRADIYSLGVVFYEMLTGEMPGQRIEPPSRKVQIDVRLDGVVLRALEKAPELRWQTAAEFRTQVETIAAQPGGTASAASWTSPKSGWGYLIGQFFGLTFTSRLAFQLANLSALGFLAFLGFMPLPGFRGCFGFSGFFGLIGVAHIVEFIARGRSPGTVQPKLFPPVSFAIALTYAGTALFGFLYERTAGPVLNRWLFVGFMLMGCAAAALAAGLKRFAGDEMRELFRKVAAVSAFVIASPVICLAIFFLRGRSQKNPDDFIIAMLIWFGAVALPVCGWRLSRGAGRVVGVAATGLLLIAIVNWINIEFRRRQSVFKTHIATEQRRMDALKSRERSAVAENLFFGPTVEFVLSNSIMIDFDTDGIVDKVFDWKQGNNGFDAAWLQSPRTTEGTLSVNMRLGRTLTPDDWEHLSPANLATNFESAWMSPGTRGNLKLDRTCVYGFQTYDDSIGILRITALTEDPRGAKILYKLVQHSAAMNTWQPPVNRSVIGRAIEIESLIAEVPVDFQFNPENMERHRLADRKDIRMLAAPRIVARDGEEAEIRIEDNAATPSPTLPPGIRLKVLPALARGNVVYQLRLSHTAPSGGPAGDTQEILLAGVAATNSPELFEWGKTANGRLVGAVVFKLVPEAGAATIPGKARK